MPSSSPSSAPDILAFRARAARYLASKHVSGESREDLLSEMVCYALAHPETRLCLELVSLQACDRLTPRHVQAGVGRVRDATREVVLEPGVLERQVAAAAGDPDALLELLRRHPSGWLRALLLLRLVHGWTECALGDLFGLSGSRISQLLGDGRAEVLASGAPEVEGEVPVLEVQWIFLD